MARTNARVLWYSIELGSNGNELHTPIKSFGKLSFDEPDECLTAETMIHRWAESFSFVFQRSREDEPHSHYTPVRVFPMHPYSIDGLTVLFPFEAYQCQLDYMKAVIECLVKV